MATDEDWTGKVRVSEPLGLMDSGTSTVISGTLADLPDLAVRDLYCWQLGLAEPVAG